MLKLFITNDEKTFMFIKLKLNTRPVGRVNIYKIKKF